MQPLCTLPTEFNKICVEDTYQENELFPFFYTKSTNLFEWLSRVFYAITASEQLSLRTWGYFSDQAMLQFYAVSSLG